jgi:Fe2+ or Zn2+ uptake regulation protein
LPTVSLKTVYETLHELEAVGEIRLSRFGTGSWRVELKPAHDHGHLVCDRCGAVCDVEADYPIVVPRSQRRHFVFGRAEVLFAGLCDSCAEGPNQAVDRKTPRKEKD